MGFTTEMNLITVQLTNILQVCTIIIADRRNQTQVHRSSVRLFNYSLTLACAEPVPVTNRHISDWCSVM